MPARRSRSLDQQFRPLNASISHPSGEREEFIREWAQGLDEDYIQIKQLGGPGDQGIDVAAFKSEQGLEGPWDCFQGKHFARELRPADAWAEILKVFLHVDAGDYVLPDTYQFLDPKGCGGTLNRLLSKPTKLRGGFLAALDAGGSLVRTSRTTSWAGSGSSPRPQIFRGSSRCNCMRPWIPTPRRSSTSGASAHRSEPVCGRRAARATRCPRDELRGRAAEGLRRRVRR